MDIRVAQPAEHLARKVAKQIVLQMILPILAFFLVLSGFAIHFHRSFELQSIFISVETPLKQAIVSGDLFTLRRVLRSLDQTNEFRNIQVFDAKRSLIETLDNTRSAFSNQVGAFDAAEVLPIGGRGDPVGYISFDRHFPFMMITLSVLIAIILVATSYLFIGSFTANLSRQLVMPVTDFSSILMKALESSNPKQAFEKQSLLAYKELDDAVGNFRMLLSKVTELEAFEIRSRKQMEINKLATQVAHDIRSPLSALKILFSTYEKNESSLIAQRAIEKIDSAANELLRSVRDQRSSRADGETEFDVNDVLIGVVSEKQIEFINSPKLLIQFQCDQSEKLSVDRTKFEFVISNLVNNSVEALKHDGVVRIRVESIDQTIAVTVADNGPGIPGWLIAQQKLRGGSFGKKNGHGIGLSTAFEFMRELGGDLEISSVPGIKTEVRLKFPKRLMSKVSINKPALQHRH